MAGGKLTVEIGADITDFENKIKEVEFDIKELSKVKLDRLKLGLDTTEINSQIKDAKANLNSLKSTVKDTGQTFASAAPKVANAGNTLTQFSRIAQDAPFGIIGIGNNITATAEAFGSLKAQTGSTGGALKALASSIAGTGGILLGVSLLTTGLTLLAQSGLTVGDVIDKITGNFDEFSASVKKAGEEAALSIGEEAFGLKSLIAIAQDDNISRKQRIAAVDELQSKYPAYFGNLSQEAILTQDLTGVTNELTQALLNKQIAQNLAKVAAPELQKLYKLFGIYKKQRAALTEQNYVLEDAIKVYGQNSETVKEATATQEGLYNQLERTRGEIYKQEQVVNRYTNSINLLNKASSKLLIKTPKAEKETKVFNTPQVTGVTNEIIPAPLFDVNGIKVFTGQVDQFGNKIKTLPGIITAEMLKATTAANEGMILFNARWEQFGLDFSAILETGIETTLADFGTAIGNSLVNGLNVLETIGASLLSSIGNTIKAVGTELIKMGILAQAYAAVVKFMKKAFANPYALAAAGVALVIVGAAISSSASKVGAGGGGGASSSSGAGANNSSFTSSGFGGGGGGGTVVFEISGQKLIGVLSNTLNANRRLGGTLGLG
jgi:hypothetical protein